MITGYVHNEHAEEALELFQKIPELSRNPMQCYDHRLYAKKGISRKNCSSCKMQLTGVKPKTITFASVLPTSANLAPLE